MSPIPATASRIDVNCRESARIMDLKLPRRFRCDRGNNFLEARITAERVPLGIETELAVGFARRDFRQSFQLLNGQVALAGLRTDHSINIKYVRAVDRVLRHGEKFHRLATL